MQSTLRSRLPTETPAHACAQEFWQLPPETRAHHRACYSRRCARFARRRLANTQMKESRSCVFRRGPKHLLSPRLAEPPEPTLRPAQRLSMHPVLPAVHLSRRQPTSRRVRLPTRSEERRVGKECRSRWWQDHEKTKT